MNHSPQMTRLKKHRQRSPSGPTTCRAAKVLPPWHFIDIGLFEGPSHMGERCETGCVNQLITETVNNMPSKALTSKFVQPRHFSPTKNFYFSFTSWVTFISRCTRLRMPTPVGTVCTFSVSKAPTNCTQCGTRHLSTESWVRPDRMSPMT